VSRRDRAEEEVRALQEIAARAARRLEILQWVILFVAAVLATAAGALIAFLASDLLGLPFRPTWMVASLLLFVVPAAWSYRRLKREGRERLEDVSSRKRESDG